MTGARMPGWTDDDHDRLTAGVELVARCGAVELQLGFLRDDVPVASAGWWAHARYQGARIMVEEKAGPLQAVEALARRLLTSAKCLHCGRLVALHERGAAFFAGGRLVDGTPVTEAWARAGQCRWRRVGAHWEPGCSPDWRATPDERTVR